MEIPSILTDEGFGQTINDRIECQLWATYFSRSRNPVLRQISVFLVDLYEFTNFEISDDLGPSTFCPTEFELIELRSWEDYFSDHSLEALREASIWLGEWLPQA